MDIRHLRTFVAVARLGSLSRAAENLHVAQPALSQHIRHMEEELGVALFVRHGRGMTLTAVGKALLDPAEQVLEKMAELRSKAVIATPQTVGEVRLGLPVTVVKLLGNRIAANVEARHPGITLQIVEAMSGHLSEWVAENQLDLAVLYDASFYPNLTPDAAWRPLLRETFRLILKPGLLDVRCPVDLGHLAAFRFVFPRRLHAIRAVIEAFQRDHGITLDIAREADSLSTLIELVRDGHATILPAVAVASELQEGKLEAHQMRPAPSRRLNLVRASTAHGLAAADLVAQVVSDTARSLIAEGRWSAASL